MSKLIHGLHHVTAISSDPRKNLDFYAGILGLRMVKKTINFDAPDVYHLYYGDEEGVPGTIMTFFPYNGLIQGQKGLGQMTVTAFSVPENSLDYWAKRLEKFNITYHGPLTRLNGERYIYLEDNDGLGIELVANDKDDRPGFTYGQIPIEYAVKGFYGVTLNESNPKVSSEFLKSALEHEVNEAEDGRIRLTSSDKNYDFVDIVSDGNHARNGSGTVHHLAFATKNDESQLKLREKILGTGSFVTEVKDRQYFHSIYFREPGGVLYEVATSDIGFTYDESVESLGTDLKLPPWEEYQRDAIAANLTPIELHTDKFID